LEIQLKLVLIGRLDYWGVTMLTFAHVE